MGIDIGTGSVKAVALDAAGNVLGSSRRYYPPSVDKVRSSDEQDVEIIFASFCECLKEITESLPSAPAVISLSSTMHSILAVDDQGIPLTAAWLWSDSRSREIAGSLRGSSLGKEIYEATGTPLHAMSPLCKLRWMRDNQPAVFSKASKFISIKEFIWHRLFSEYAIDHSLASATGLFDIQNRQWYKPALEFAGVGERQLSLPLPSVYTKQLSDDAMMRVTGLARGSLFCLGASDGCLANLGMFCLDPSVAAVTVGTSAAVRLTLPHPIRDHQLMFFNYLLDGNYVCGGAVNNGGNTIQWLLNNFLGRGTATEDYEYLYKVIEAVPPGAGGLLFLPYLHGERAPVWDEESTGVFFGIRSHHTQAHFARAVVEGVFFGLKEVLSNLEKAAGPVQVLRLSGGVIASAVAIQLLADITGKRIEQDRSDDASALGAACLGWKALGAIGNYQSFERPSERIIHPQAESSRLYQRLFEVYKQLYPATSSTMHQLMDTFIK